MLTMWVFGHMLKLMDKVAPSKILAYIHIHSNDLLNSFTLYFMNPNTPSQTHFQLLVLAVINLMGKIHQQL